MIRIIFLISTLTVFAQNAFQNNGNVQIHSDAQVGFHTNLVNNGTFYLNEGFTGFYSDDILTVSGANRAIFNNVEIAVVNNLELYTSMGVKNELSFLEGKIITPRSLVPVSLDFINHNFYAGESDERYVDGYASVTGNNSFTFPIGDGDRLRPMILPKQNNSNIFKGAYFFEDPNSPSTFGTNFNTDIKEDNIDVISNLEFWDLNGNTKTNITLTWDSQSNIDVLSDNDINNLRVVGWHTVNNIWEDLGNTNVTGNVTRGTITSKIFKPNNYELITIGAINIKGEFVTDTNNYLISPNGDEINDGLVFEGLEDFKYNLLSVYNRWGNIVLKAKNYKNDWKGISDGRATIMRDDKLPVGTYFYVLRFGNTSENENIKKGWVYIDR